MPAAEACSALTANSIKLVDEDEARCILLGILKEIPNPGGTDPHKHFHKFRATDAEKRYARFSRNCPGQQRLTRTWRSNQQDSLGDFCSYFVVLLRMLQEIYDFYQFLLCLVDTCDMLEGNPALVLMMQTGSAFAERHGAVVAALHLIHNKQPEQSQHNDENNIGQQGHPPRSLGRQFRFQLNISGFQPVSNICHLAHGHQCCKIGPVFEPPFYMLIPDKLYRGYFIVFDKTQQLRVVKLLGRSSRGVKITDN